MKYHDYGLLAGLQQIVMCFVLTIKTVPVALSKCFQIFTEILSNFLIGLKNLF